MSHYLTINGDSTPKGHKYTCPKNQLVGDVNGEFLGCGHTFEATPDDEGLIDCPQCGLWFSK